ncbi:MAG: TetR/AcrR family transcriptional regulator [Rhodocyclaceae bacterium]|nr:TetR/AcrR family transcriptional regulator [Rhodocyclaceae bacterium]
MSADDERNLASKADVRRGQILAAAETCVLDEGFHRASISKICKLAGMSPGHVYHYFENKEAIIAALVRQDLDRILDMTAGMRASPDVLEAMTDRVAQGVAEKLDAREARLKLEIAAEASRNPNIAPIVRDADACSLASLRETIAAARRGRGLSDDEATAAELAQVAAAMFEGLVIRGVRNPDIDRAAIVRRYTVMLRALILS